MASPSSCCNASVNQTYEQQGVGTVENLLKAGDAVPIYQQRVYLHNLPVRSQIPKYVPPIQKHEQELLPIEAQQSSADQDVWVYPSPQRFYNAMRKKGYEPNEIDVPYIVAIHNQVNEQAWRQVMRYEQMHNKECSSPKLQKFQGRPGDLSIKAYIRSILGYTNPFDRHDWTVNRCGKEVRYIIDFYQGPSTDVIPSDQYNEQHHSPAAIAEKPSIYIDARPAPTIEGLIDRARMALRKLFEIS